MQSCAPGKYDREHDTCFSLDQLLEMARAYNRYISGEKMGPHRSNQDLDLITIKNDKAYLLKELHQRFQRVCGGDDYCLTQQRFMEKITEEMKDDILQNTFRPQGPKSPTEWLTTSHIEKILSQYQSVYPEFIFLGAVPLDCNELHFCSLYRINYDKLVKQNKTKIGIVFNHDTYGSPGSHWVALYIDIKSGEIDFCDSSGGEPIRNIGEIIEGFRKWYNHKYGKNPTYKQNKKNYQMDSSECGIYSSNFIIQRLADRSFDKIVNQPLDFKQINSCRNVYFRNKPSKYPSDPLCDPGSKNLNK